MDSVSETVDIVDNDGRMITSQIDVTLKEYIAGFN